MTIPSSRTSALPLGLSVVLLAVLCWAFGPLLLGMAERWQNDSRYTHGYLVPLFSLFLVWARRDQLREREIEPSWWGLPLLLFGLLIGAAGVVVYFEWFNAVALVFCIAGGVVLIWGLSVFAVVWPAVAFLLFMAPLPFTVEVALARPLQAIATRASTWSLQLFGFSAFAEGNTIRMGEIQLGVVEACSGLSMLMAFFALCTAVALLLEVPLWERLLIVVCAIPVAVLSNIVRIVVTGVLHKLAGSEIADLVFHDLAGWLMMPLALGFLWVACRMFSWVFPLRDEEEFEEGPILLG